MSVEPIFLTYKYKISNLNSVINVHDFQLRDHFLNSNNLYTLQCKCSSHKHNKRSCVIIDNKICPKCETPTKLLMPFQSVLYHGKDLTNKEVYTCCTHTHKPPCKRCLGCNTNINGQKQSCIVHDEFECIFTTDVVCPRHPNQFTKKIDVHNAIIQEHVYNTKLPIFYFCNHHIHKHNANTKVNCYVQIFKCCENAIMMKDYHSSFIITSNEIVYNNGIGKSRGNEYIIYDPSIWREQSFNHFISFVRAVINLPEAVKERYGRFEDSNFSIPSLKKYKSGKDSIVRSAVTGFETKGIYQTATISCLVPYYKVIIPQTLYCLLEEQGYDLTLVCVKRDPSIKTTCMFVCVAEKNLNPKIEAIVISDAIAKPLNQDQDGDKNAIYLLPLKQDNYDTRNSYSYTLAKLELAAAFRKTVTLIATPRYSISETNLMHIKRHPEYFMDLEFAKRTIKYGPKFMIEAGCGYLKNEYEEFIKRLIEINKNPHHTYITTQDLILKTDRLSSIISSGAKGSKDHLEALLNNITTNTHTLSNCESDMIELVNRYITSSQDLSRNGRNQFAALYAGGDLIVFNGKIYHNKVFIADYTPFASCGLLMWSNASLKLFSNDIMYL